MPCDFGLSQGLCIYGNHFSIILNPKGNLIEFIETEVSQNRRPENSSESERPIKKPEGYPLEPIRIFVLIRIS